MTLRALGGFDEAEEVDSSEMAADSVIVKLNRDENKVPGTR